MPGNTFDPSNLTNANLVRVLIGDTNTTAGEYAFDDEVIAGFLTLNNDDVHLTAADLCRALATDSSRHAIAVKLLEDEIDTKSVSSRLLEMARDFEAKAGRLPASTMTTFPDEDGDYIDNTLMNRNAFDYEENA